LKKTQHPGFILVFTLMMAIIYSSCSQKINSHTERKKQFSWSDSTTLSEKQKELKRVWDKFITPVKNEDFITLKKLSTTCVYCPECKKDSLKDYYDCTSIEEFIRQCEFKIFYWEGSYVQSISEHDSLNYSANFINKESHKTYTKELEITIGDDCKGWAGIEECSQTVVFFVKSEDGYKFCGYRLQP
jgi:hypothetical protein